MESPLGQPVVGPLAEHGQGRFVAHVVSRPLEVSLGIAHIPECGPEPENLGLGDLDHGALPLDRTEQSVKTKNEHRSLNQQS